MLLNPNKDLKQDTKHHRKKKKKKGCKRYGLRFLKLRDSATQVPKKLINYVVDNLSLYAKLIPDITSLSSVELHCKCIWQIVMFLLQE